MDSSKNFEEVEECQSSESGWTMYIGSPSNGEENGDGELDFDEEDNNNAAKHDDEDGDTDDSMASDASSGAIGHKVQFSRNGKSGVRNKNSKEKGKDKGCCLTKKTNNSMKIYGYKNEDKEESVFSSKGAKVLVSNDGNKVRKSIWMGKRK